MQGIVLCVRAPSLRGNGHGKPPLPWYDTRRVLVNVSSLALPPSLSQFVRACVRACVCKTIRPTIREKRTSDPCKTIRPTIREKGPRTCVRQFGRPSETKDLGLV